MTKTLRSIAFFLLSLNSLSLWAQSTNEAHAQARTVKYASKDIISISTRPKFSSLILLPEQERILDFVIGDRDAWVLEGTKNFAYLKPTKSGLETSMNLITAAGNIYTFYCTSSDERQPDLKLFVEPSEEKLLSAMNGTPRFILASDADQLRQAASLQVQAAQQQSNQFRADYPVKNVKADYKFEKNKKPFKVSAIYHDDKFTYIHSWAQEKPTLFEIRDGSPTLINFTLDNGVYVVEHIVDKGYLAIGKHKLNFEREGN